MNLPKRKAYGILQHYTELSLFRSEPSYSGAVYSEDGRVLGSMTSTSEEFLQRDMQRLIDNTQFDYKYTRSMPDGLAAMLETVRNKDGY